MLWERLPFNHTDAAGQRTPSDTARAAYWNLLLRREFHIFLGYNVCRQALRPIKLNVLVYVQHHHLSEEESMFNFFSLTY